MRAKKHGFYGGHLIPPGSTFTYDGPADQVGKWMEPVGDDVPDQLAQKISAAPSTKTLHRPRAGERVGRVPGQAPAATKDDASADGAPTGATKVLGE
jgi:hypothetical protein